MSVILVCPTERAAALAREHRPSHVLGLASPDTLPGNSSGRQAGEPRSGVSKHAPGWRPEDPPATPGSRASRRGLEPLLSMTPLAETTSARHLALAFHDIAGPRPGLTPPTAADIDAIVAFGRSWDGARPLLVHCAMGISRSTAAALALAADRCPDLAEADLAHRLRAAAPCATPNPLLVALADAALGRDGRLVAAAVAIGRGSEYVPQAGFALGLRACAPGALSATLAS